MKKGSHILPIAFLLLLLALAVLLVLPHIPRSEKCLSKSMAVLERADYYVVSLYGQPLFRLDNLENWTTSHMTTDLRDSTVARITRVKGTWARRTLQPLCRGRLFVAGADTSVWNSQKAAQAALMLREQREVLRQRLETMEKRIEELQYFMKVHKVTDEGFNVVAEWLQRATDELRNVRLVMAVLNDSTRLDKMTIRFVHDYTLLNINNDTTSVERRIPCHILKANTLRGKYLVQTRNHWMPDSICPVYENEETELYRQEQTHLLNQNNDTTNASLAIDEALYNGETNRQWVPNGHGIMRSPSGKVYDGMWKDGRRHGFGISMDGDGRLRVGEWQEDVYQGERLTYTVEHVYGIDISRHQHEKGKKKYSIDWSRLRISSLGTLSKKRISGSVDYPVSFCFVKATEGTTVYNQYYSADCQQARRQGIHVGSYHFFSLKSSARDQATTFLRYARFPKGDLPPVLDVEPTNAQINAFGGTEKLLNAIRTWLQIVERNVGVRPILYVNQGFVTKHLAEASDIKRDYQVWIARYGEYKPDVRLAIWQLSPDGNVTGIRGSVDINIFNGYRDQFELFLEEHCIK
ncbi:MAG: glycosyl hydrolase family 25 [Prevotella sp.]|nr:glycosyl hydrolase family 25 [Prevotella sp.]